MRADLLRWASTQGAAQWAALFLLCLLVIPVSVQAQARPSASVERTFGDLIDYDRKLIEISGIPLAGDIPAGLVCLVSAARLTPRAEPVPPRKDLSRPNIFQFGGVWRATPRTATGPQGKDLLRICGPYLRADGFSDKITAALEAPGSHYLSDFTGSLLQIYSPGQRFALSLRLVPGKDK